MTRKAAAKKVEGRQSARRKGLTGVSALVGRRMEQVRGNLTKEELGQRLAAHGVAMHPSAITKIEKGERSVTVDELLLFALLLDVSPIALLLPLGPEDDLELAVAPGISLGRFEALAWLRGFEALPSQDERGFRRHVLPIALEDGVREAAQHAGVFVRKVRTAEYHGDDAAATRARRTAEPALRNLAKAIQDMRRSGYEVGDISEELQNEMRALGIDLEAGV